MALDPSSGDSHKRSTGFTLKADDRVVYQTGSLENEGYTAKADIACGREELVCAVVLTGLDGEFQHNRRDGWGFIIPDFETLSTGVFAVDKWTVSDALSLNAGVRYDYVRTSIHSYQDWYPTEGEYKQRSADILRNFNSLTWSAGLSWTPGRWVLKANAGKSFRVPIPKELGADGVNYHIFRYEKGNADLSPEESYQLDLGINYLGERVTLRLDPFLNWFPNYIYLNPSADYYEGLQRYAYTQAQVLRAGAEAQVDWHIFRFLEAEAKGEYLFARQMSGDKKGYGLPFSPPWGGEVSLKYTFLEDGYILSWKMALSPWVRVLRAVRKTSFLPKSPRKAGGR